MTRGEIYYINKDLQSPAIGREQYAARPGVIVSNDKNNACSGNVNVVYLTTQPKKDLPTHVTVRSSRVTSTALCEQIHTVSKERIGDYLGTCTDDEMKSVDAALSIQLALQEGPRNVTPTERIARQKEQEIIQITTERDTYKKLYEDIMAKLIRKVRLYDKGNNA